MSDEELQDAIGRMNDEISVVEISIGALKEAVKKVDRILNPPPDDQSPPGWLDKINDAAAHTIRDFP